MRPVSSPGSRFGSGSGSVFRFLLLGLALVAGAARADERSDARDQARKLLRAPCGACHASDEKTAKPGALAFFDLASPEWAAHLDADDFAFAAKRLAGAVKGDSGAAARAALDRYTKLELASRPAR
jgi:mono/diheme cytochrome c family protein